jgi:hypothetical protein
MREGDFFSSIISPSLLGEGFRERLIYQNFSIYLFSKIQK